MEPTSERNWGPFVAGVLLVVGIGLCLGTLALAWWWTHPPAEVGSLPTPMASFPSAAPALWTPLPRVMAPTVPTPGTGTRPTPTPAAGHPVPPGGSPVLPPPPTPTAVPQPQQVPLLVEDFSLFRTSDMLEALLASPAGRPVRVVVQEGTLNRDLAYLAEMAKAEKEVSVDSVTVELRPEGVWVSGEAKAGFLRGRYQVLAQITAQDCRPVVKVQKIHIGGLPAPAFVRQQLENEVGRSLDLWWEGVPLCLEQVFLEHGRGTLVGHR
ncbi:MAG: hypothetical protein ACUVS5_13860 [Anaerolineae bacterium]